MNGYEAKTRAYPLTNLAAPAPQSAHLPRRSKPSYHPHEWRYLWRAAQRLEALARHDARTPRVYRIAAQLASPETTWQEDVMRVWHWLPTHYLAERHGDHWQAVAETLRLHTGDCEDWALVMAAVLKALGIDAYMLTMPAHVAVALPVPAEYVAQRADGLFDWPIYRHADQWWLFLEATLPPAERRHHVPGANVGHIARWANTPYLQIAEVKAFAPPAWSLVS